MARRTGRPRRFEMPVYRSIILEEEHLEEARKRATAEGESVSAWIRRVVLKAMGRGEGTR